MRLSEGRTRYPLLPGWQQSQLLVPTKLHGVLKYPMVCVEYRVLPTNPELRKVRGCPNYIAQVPDKEEIEIWPVPGRDDMLLVQI